MSDEKELSTIPLDVLKTLSRDIMAAVSEAYHLGVLRGKREATEEMKTVLEKTWGVIARTNVPQVAAASDSDAQRVSRIRAPRGSIGPAVEAALRENPNGLRPVDIAKAKGVSENSARSSLNKLLKDGKVVKRDDRWFPAGLLG